MHLENNGSENSRTKKHDTNIYPGLLRPDFKIGLQTVINIKITTWATYFAPII